MKTTLSSTQASDYDRDGYLMLHRPVFSPDKFARVKALCAEKFAQAGGGQAAPALVDCPHWQDPRMFEWLFADEMISIVEPLIGPDIGVFACHLLQKPPQVGKRVPWHEDSAYWRGALQPMQVASVTLALEPCLAENGCLRVVPGSHRHGNSDHAQFSKYVDVAQPESQVFNKEMKRSEVNEAKAVNIVLQPNEASVHHVKIIHGSNPNTSQVRRAVLTVRYFPTTVKFVPEAHPAFKGAFHIYLARGVDRAGNHFSDPSQVYSKNDHISTA